MKRITIALCALAMVGLAVWAQARTVTVVVGQPPAAAGGAGIDLTLEYETLASEYRTNSTMNKPANTVDGDFLLAAIHLTESVAAITPPSGWTSIAQYTHPDADRGSIEVFYKRASSEGASWTWTHAYKLTNSFVVRISGVIASGDPEDVAESTVYTGYVNTGVTNPGITTATNGAALCQIVAFSESVTLTGHDLTSRIIVSGGGGGGGQILLDADLQSTAGASGNKTVSRSTYTRAIGIMIALRPAS